jgi:hypothetical protein
MYSLALATEVRRAASDRAPLSASKPSGRASIRGGIAEGQDGESIDRLAALSRRPAPQGAVLFAEVGGEPVAAIGLFDGNAVADLDRSSLGLRLRLRLERLFVLSVISVRGM